MTLTTPLPSLDTLKTQAKRLRAELAKSGTAIGHSAALELLARQQGFKDWNTLHAATGRQSPAPLSLGQKISGLYLDQPFTGEVVAVQSLSTPDMFRVTVHFDQPVDVVTFEGLSNFRQRVSAIVSREGVSAEKTSNGKPHLVLQI